MTKTRSGDEEDNTSKGIQFLKERIGMRDVFRDVVFSGMEVILPPSVVDEAYEELIIDVSDCIDFELFPPQRTAEVNEMFANLGAAYGNKPKSISEAMFNT